MASKVKGKSKKAASTGGATRRGRTRTSRLSSQHQVTIPVDVLREAGFVVGDELVFTLKNGELVIGRNIHPMQALLEEVFGVYARFDFEAERADAWRD